MIPRLLWEHRGRLKPNPYVRGRDEPSLRVTFHTGSLAACAGEDAAALTVLRDLIAADEIEAYAPEPAELLDARQHYAAYLRGGPAGGSTPRGRTLTMRAWAERRSEATTVRIRTQEGT